MTQFHCPLPDLSSHLPHKLNIFCPSSPSSDSPSVSRFQVAVGIETKERNDGGCGYGMLQVGRIHPISTIIDEFFRSSTSIFFIKLFRLSAYPLSRAQLDSYRAVKYCEVRYFVDDFSKLFHFLAELPSLKKVSISHAAVCDGPLDASGSGQPAPPMYPRLRTCLSLKIVDLTVDKRFYAESTMNKYQIAERVRAIGEYLLDIAPNLTLAKFVTPSEIDLSPLYDRYRVVFGDMPLPDGNSSPGQPPILLIVVTHGMELNGANGGHSDHSGSGNSGSDPVQLMENADDDDVIFLDRVTNGTEAQRAPIHHDEADNEDGNDSDSSDRTQRFVPGRNGRQGRGRGRATSPSLINIAHNGVNGHGQPRHYYGE